MALKLSPTAWVAAAVPPEKDTGLGTGRPVGPARAAGGTAMRSIMKIGTKTIFRKEAGSMRDTETGTEKETGITEICEIFPGNGRNSLFYGLTFPVLNQD